MKIKYFGKTDKGLKRLTNEDIYHIESKRNVCLIADGMGGNASGELASQIFRDTTLEVLKGADLSGRKGARELIKEAYLSANESIRERVRRHPSNYGMGCTAELAVYSDDKLLLGHIGDSRTYLLRGNRLRQLTHDHSVVQSMIDQGLISEADAKNNVHRHKILKAVGLEENVEIDLITGTVRPGDIFLICSDGVTDMVDNATIASILGGDGRLSAKGSHLLKAIYQEGALDNISFVLAQIVGI